MQHDDKPIWAISGLAETSHQESGTNVNRVTVLLQHIITTHYYNILLQHIITTYYYNIFNSFKRLHSSYFKK